VDGGDRRGIRELAVLRIDMTGLGGWRGCKNRLCGDRLDGDVLRKALRSYKWMKVSLV
jgi:hypothetical protein